MGSSGLEWREEESIAVLHGPRESLTKRPIFEQRPKGDEEERFPVAGAAGAKALSRERGRHI